MKTSDKPIQEQIDEINRKLDLILDETLIQRQNRESVNDLLDDVAIIGKDVFKQTVIQLDNAGIELDGDALRCLLLRLVRNISSLGMVLQTLESLTDLAKDLTPIVKQIGLDGVNKFYEFEQKGYFDLLSQLAETLDKTVTRYSREEIQQLSDNLVPVVDTLMNIADPKLLSKVNAAATALKEIDPDKIEEYSVWKLMRKLGKPEVRKSLGFVMAFLDNIAKTKSIN
ncbi:MAG: DUF1641 domain-containing protein [Bacteroidales bacterium]|nr:DUF1641 domain-containing protein [Bacteroidales bacterium]